MIDEPSTSSCTFWMRPMRSTTKVSRYSDWFFAARLRVMMKSSIKTAEEKRMKTMVRIVLAYVSGLLETYQLAVAFSIASQHLPDHEETHLRTRTGCILIILECIDPTSPDPSQDPIASCGTPRSLLRSPQSSPQRRRAQTTPLPPCHFGHDDELKLHCFFLFSFVRNC